MIIRNILKAFMVFTLIISVLAGCSKKEEAETVDIKDIQAEEGVPIRVEEVETRTMVISKRYSNQIGGLVLKCKMIHIYLIW